MGDCYSATLHVKFKKNGKREAEKAVRKYIREHDGKDCDFSLKEYRDKTGFNVSSWDGIVHVMLADWYRTNECSVDKDILRDTGFMHYENGFNASYGWGCVLYDFAKIIAPFLDDGSFFYVDADETKIELEVDNGEFALT